MKHTVGVEIIDESELQMSKGKMWKGLECHGNTHFLVNNDYSKVRKLKKILETLQFKPFS